MKSFKLRGKAFRLTLNEVSEQIEKEIFNETKVKKEQDKKSEKEKTKIKVNKKSKKEK
ncbi:MAG: hypothetical protein P8X70_01520 [Nanoarchaeota archaeon]